MLLFFSNANFSLAEPPAASEFSNKVDVTSNLFNGQTSVSLPIVSLGGRNGMDLGVTLSYSSQGVSDPNSYLIEEPVSWVGDGWSIDFGSIVHNTKDYGELLPEHSGLEREYHLNLPGTTSDRIVGEATERRLEKNPYFKIIDGSGYPERDFVAYSPDGTYYEFGHKAYHLPKHRRVEKTYDNINDGGNDPNTYSRMISENMDMFHGDNPATSVGSFYEGAPHANFLIDIDEEELDNCGYYDPPNGPPYLVSMCDYAKCNNLGNFWHDSTIYRSGFSNNPSYDVGECNPSGFCSNGGSCDDAADCVKFDDLLGVDPEPSRHFLTKIRDVDGNEININYDNYEIPIPYSGAIRQNTFYSTWDVYDTQYSCGQNSCEIWDGVSYPLPDCACPKLGTCKPDIDDYPTGYLQTNLFQNYGNAFDYTNKYTKQTTISSVVDSVGRIIEFNSVNYNSNYPNHNDLYGGGDEDGNWVYHGGPPIPPCRGGSDCPTQFPRGDGDLVQEKRLESIDIYNVDGSLYQTIEFGYDYFREDIEEYKKLILKNITVVSSDGTRMPPIKFEYEPYIPYSGNLLKKIIYPTGGFTEISYLDGPNTPLINYLDGYEIEYPNGIPDNFKDNSLINSITVDNGMGDVYTTSYDYSDGALIDCDLTSVGINPRSECETSADCPIDFWTCNEEIGFCLPPDPDSCITNDQCNYPFDSCDPLLHVCITDPYYDTSFVCDKNEEWCPNYNKFGDFAEQFSGIFANTCIDNPYVGFAKVVENLPGEYGRVEHYYYNSVDDEYCDTCDDLDTIEFADKLNGMEWKTEYYNSDDVLVREVTNEYYVYNAENILEGSYWPFLKEISEITDGVNIKRIQSLNIENGQIQSSQIINSEGEILTTSNNYAFYIYPEMEEKNMLVQPYETYVFSPVSGPPSHLKQYSKTTWQNYGGVWRPYETYSGVDNSLHDDEQLVSRILSYDYFGNVLESEDAMGHVTKVYFGNAETCDNVGNEFSHALPTCVENELGYQVKTSYDSNWNLNSVRDINNQVFYYGYDNFNRLSNMTLPGETEPSVFYDYWYAEEGDGISSENPNYIYTKTFFDLTAGEYSESWQHADGVGKVYQNQVAKDDLGNAIIQTNEFNPIGKVEKIYEPSEGEVLAGKRAGSGINFIKQLFVEKEEIYKEEIDKLKDEGKNPTYVEDFNGGGWSPLEDPADYSQIFYTSDPLARLYKSFPLAVYGEGDENSDCGDGNVCTKIEYGSECIGTPVNPVCIAVPYEYCDRVVGCEWVVVGGQAACGSTQPEVEDCELQDFAVCEYINGCELQGNYTLTRVIDLEGKETISKIDKLGNLVEVHDSLGGVIAYEYDVLGNLLKVYDAEGRLAKSTVYNTLGQVERAWDLDSYLTEYTYDLNGNVDEVITPNGDTIKNSYDSLNRIDYVDVFSRWEDCPTNERCWKTILDYTYDSCANGIGKLCRIDDNVYSTSIAYEYDEKGQIIQVAEIMDYGVFETVYDYDLAGNVISISTSMTGDVTVYDYNMLGQLWKVKINEDEIEYAYNPEGTVDLVNYPNGVATDYTYNNRNFVEEIKIDNPTGNLFDEQYYYDNVGNLLRTEDWEPINNNPGTEGKCAEFNYDTLYRLTGVTDRGQSCDSSQEWTDYYNPNPDQGIGINLDYTYDSVGNRLTRDVGGYITDPWDETYIYGYEGGQANGAYQNNKLAFTESDTVGDCNYHYDAAGNLRSKRCNDGQTKVEYIVDYKNMITDIIYYEWENNDYVLTGESLSFEYDALGRRIKKLVITSDSELETVYSYGLGMNPLFEDTRDLLAS
jgi:YD repeat-containing protein